MMTELPLVSVIMNCFNGSKYLREAIDSVVSQGYPSWEIVFYDNGSTDNSGSIACSYGDKLRYFRGEQTVPLGAARNAAITHANGEFVAFLDTDDQWLPDKLEAQVALMQAHPEAALCYSNVYVLSEASERMRLAYKKTQPSGRVFAPFLRYYPLNLQTVIVRRDALLSMPEMFDPTLEVSEEYDVFIRLLHGAQAIYLDQPTAIYRVHSQMTSVRKNNLYPVENEYILRKLCELIPNLEQMYPGELRYLRAKIGYWHAVANMAKGNKRQARERLNTHKWTALEFMVLYLATYFPAAVWRTLLSTKTMLGAR